MTTRLFAARLFVVSLLGVSSLYGQDYPSKPIRIIAGPGAADLMSRLIAQGISAPLGQPVVIENRPGQITGQTVAKAPPDGYTLLVSGGSFYIVPLLQKTPPYDPLTDFAPISIVASTPTFLIVNPSLPAMTVKELIALAKARPGELNYSIGGVGGTGHLGMELFKSMARVNIVGIPYSSSSQELADLVSGYVQLTITPSTALLEQVKAGKLRALGVTTTEPTALAPGLPTVAASGLPGYEVVSVTGIYAPAKTPSVIINRLNQEIVLVLKRADVKEKLFDAGVEVVGSSPEQLSVKMKSEMTKWAKLIKNTGIKVD